MIAWIVITLCCISGICGDTLTALGRVIVLVLWLGITALWVVSAHAQPITPPATPTAVPAPPLDESNVRCTTRDVGYAPFAAGYYGPKPDTTNITCCALWNGNRFGQGRWEPLGCTR